MWMMEMIQRKLSFSNSSKNSMLLWAKCAACADSLVATVFFLSFLLCLGDDGGCFD